MDRPIIRPSHVAVLVPSVRRAAQVLRGFHCDIGPEEDWEGEGTREIYVEKGRANSLLLMEPIKPGAYQRALEKRGPGFHHLAIDVLNLNEFILSIAGTGWLLHPKSIETMKRVQTAYLARPGFPALIEVQECKEIAEESDLFVRHVHMKIPKELRSLTAAIGLEQVISPTDGPVAIEVSSHKIELTKLYA